MLEHTDRLGSVEGVGVHLQAASLPLEEDGSLSQEALARFYVEGEKAMEKLESAQLNNMVLIALYLTMFVSLAVLHAGTLGYAHPVPEVFGDAEHAWADLATFVWPDDSQAQQGLRRALHIAECIAIAAGVATCINALQNAQYLFISFGVGLPSLVAKYEYFLRSGATNMMMVMKRMEYAMLFLLLSLAFVTTRGSVIMSFCSLGALVVVVLRIFDDGLRKGIIADYVCVQHSEARAILAAATQHPAVHQDAQRIDGRVG